MNLHYYLRVAALTLFTSTPFQIIWAQCSQPNGTIIVSSLADEGIGTLRDAINCANLEEGPNRIVFDIATDSRAIIFVGNTSNEPLPPIVDSETIIDATTQPGFGENGNFEPRIVLDGSAVDWDLPINALKILGNSAEVYGLEIRHFPDDGIDVEEADDVIIGAANRGNVIYDCGAVMDVFPGTGTQNRYEGVAILGTSNADRMTIRHNIIGTNYNQTIEVGNEWCGVYLRFGADFAVIENNIIAHHETGIRLRNAFGVTFSENNLYCNRLHGIELVDGANDDKQPPQILAASNRQISGTGRPGNQVEVFLTSNCSEPTPCQGGTLLGSATVANDGNWTLNAPYLTNVSDSQSVTALATDMSNRTSTFAECLPVQLEATCADAAGVILVTNTNDEGQGSLRAAIECANTTPGANRIHFNITTPAPHIISIGATSGEPLPFLRDVGTVIDGSTQAEFSGIPVVILDGSSHDWQFPHNALWVRADSCEIYSLEIRNFPDDGIDITGSDYTIVGAPGKGNVVYNCGADKDYFEEIPNTGPWNGCGIVLKNGAEFSIIQSNIIGTDASLINTAGNEFCGIILEEASNNNKIGGFNPGEGNIIANNIAGISGRQASQNNEIIGNRFFCNASAGIALSGGGNNELPQPVINLATLTLINGSGTDGQTIDLYLKDENCLDSPCQGSFYLGSVAVTGSNWQLEAPFATAMTVGQQVTALARDAQGNTSEFAVCKIITDQTPPADCELSLGISNYQNETCQQNDGTFTLTVTNAELPVMFSYDEITTDNPVFSNLSEGNYSITATDARGCAQSLLVTLFKESEPELAIENIFNEKCGNEDGRVELSVTGGKSPFLYELNTGPISRNPVFENLPAGQYAVTVRDANNCTASELITIERTGTLETAVTNLQADNCGASTGGLTVVVTGGQAPYQYDIGNGAGEESSFSNLRAGFYQVSVSDAANCTATLEVEIPGNPAPSVAISRTGNTVCNANTGLVELSVQGGTPPFQFDLGDRISTDPIFDNLAAGNYQVTVSDANSCSVVRSFTIEEPESPFLNLIERQDATCGNANGLIAVVAAGGTAPYVYDIGNGTSSQPVFEGLAAGNYTLTLTDNNGCEAMLDIPIANSPTPAITVKNIQMASCSQFNGIIEVSASGVRPFTFSYGEGETTDSVFNAMGPGNYTIQLTDGNGCTASVSVTVESTGGPELNVVTTSEARCGDANGTIEVSAVGGFEPYFFDIGNGPTDSPIFTDLAGGDYEITLTDANNCVATRRITLGNIPQPTFGIGNLQDATCGEANGSFQISAFGGRPPYEFSLGSEYTTASFFDNLRAGIYTATVRDANGCKASLNVTVEGFEAPEIIVIDNKAADCDQSNGAFSFSVNGGLPPYFFDIGNGETSEPAFTNLSAGTYEVTVTDLGGCSQVIPVQVDGTSDWEVNLQNITPAACGEPTGSFSIVPEGGQTPYRYELNGQITADPEVTNLAAGNYEIKTTDANGCSITRTLEILSTDEPSVELVVQNDCGSSGAQLQVIASGGVAPYTYNIGDGPVNSSIFEEVGQGSYRVRVTDANGCETIQPVTINVSATAPQAAAVITRRPDCGEVSGSFEVNVSKGTPPFSYQLGEQTPSPFNTFSGLSPGQYEVVVKDAGGCTTTIPVDLLNEANAPQSAFSYQVNGNQVAVFNNSENATSYEWDFGDGSTSNREQTTHQFGSNGNFTICLTAGNDCGSDTYCQEVSIAAVNVNQDFEFAFGRTVVGNQGDMVKIPVYVMNFDDIVGFQKSVFIADTSLAKIRNITDVNLKDLSTSLFNIRADRYSVTWFDGNISGFDLPDSTIIYQIEIEIVAQSGCTELLLGDDPLPVQVYQKRGNDEVEVSYFQRFGKICAGSPAPDFAMISGMITSEEGYPVSQVNLSCTGNADLKNNADGRYLFDNQPTGNNYTIRPQKNINTLNGVTTYDLVQIQNHILGNQLLDSPYQLLAADVNRSGSITALDILELRKLLLQNITEFSNNESWRFVPADYQFVNPANPLLEEIPEQIDFRLENDKTDLDFIAIKVGDVNGSMTPNSWQTTQPRNRSVAFMHLPDRPLKAGEWTNIRCRLDDWQLINGCQFTLQFDPSALQVVLLENKNNALQSIHIGNKELQKGRLLVSWNKEDGQKTEQLTTLRVKAAQSGSLRQLLQIAPQSPLLPEVYYKNGNIRKLQLQFDKSTGAEWQIAQNSPNPFRFHTTVAVTMPERGTVALKIFDTRQRLIWQESQILQKGHFEWHLSRELFPQSGVYWYQLESAFGTVTRKMVVID